MHGRAHVATRAYPTKAASDRGRVAVSWEPRTETELEVEAEAETKTKAETEGSGMSGRGQRAAVADVRVWRMGAGVQWLS